MTDTWPFDPATIRLSWHGDSGKFTLTTEDYRRHWALEGPINARAGMLAQYETTGASEIDSTLTALDVNHSDGLRRVYSDLDGDGDPLPCPKCQGVSFHIGKCEG